MHDTGYRRVNDWEEIKDLFLLPKLNAQRLPAGRQA
jgi:hypothetical protein